MSNMRYSCDMKKCFSFQNVIIVVLVLVIAGLGGLYMQQRKLNKDIQRVAQDQGQIYNEVDARFQQLHLVSAPKEGRMYLPELKVSLPLNPTTESFLYYGQEGGDIRLSTTLMVDHQTHVMSCQDMVRVKVEAKPNAYSPSQPLYATVQLSDGRTLQVYTSKSKACDFAWQPLNPSQIADQFKEAITY